MDRIDGVITCGDKGKFTVYSDIGYITCNAKGVFRNKDLSPMAGDRVTLSLSDPAVNTDISANTDPSKSALRGIIEEIHPRSNAFVRPKMTNLDTLFIVASIVEPALSLLIIDKLTAICCYKEVTPILVLTKTDLSEYEHVKRIYDNAGIVTFCTDKDSTDEFSKIYPHIKDRTVAFVGNTGVGKSSLLNRLFNNLQLATGEISKKLGRGRHTTRTVTLYRIDEYNAFVADTPGFGAVETNRYDIITADELQYCFKEFTPFLHSCRFTGCSHTSERDCAIKNACKDGFIEPTRLDSYTIMYNEAKQLKHWEYSER